MWVLTEEMFTVATQASAALGLNRSKPARSLYTYSSSQVPLEISSRLPFFFAASVLTDTVDMVAGFRMKISNTDGV